MIDVHMHIIPGVDDGARDIQMAEEMLWMEVVQGVTDVFATSHSDAFLWYTEKVRGAYKELLELVRIKGIPVHLYLGCEVYCEPDLMENVLNGLANGLIPSMNGTRYLLTEFYRIKKEEAFYCLEELLKREWIPIIAHAERYDDLDVEFYKKVKALGCKIQMNAYSIEEEWNQTIKEKARALITEKLVDFIGSDAHRIYHRPPAVREGVEYVKHNCDKEYVNEITYKNAKSLLVEGEKL